VTQDARWRLNAPVVGQMMQSVVCKSRFERFPQSKFDFLVLPIFVLRPEVFRQFGNRQVSGFKPAVFGKQAQLRQVFDESVEPRHRIVKAVFAGPFFGAVPQTELEVVPGVSAQCSCPCPDILVIFGDHLNV